MNNIDGRNGRPGSHPLGAPAIVKLWSEEARPCTSHPFLDRMGIDKPGDVRVVGDTLLIPMWAFGKGLVNLQRIQPDGRISHMPNAPLRGTVFPFGSDTPGQPDTIYLCEGWPNGWTIHNQTRVVVFAVFRRSDLVAVATQIRRMNPTELIVVAATNDRWCYHTDGEWQIPSPGVMSAIKVQDHVEGVKLAIPDFSDLDGRPTGFNDLRQREGPEAVLRWLDPDTMPHARTEPEGHDILDRICSARVVEHPYTRQPTSVGELLRLVGGSDEGVCRRNVAFDDTVRLLRDCGLRVENGSVLLANGSPWLRDRLATRWPDGEWRPTLRELDEVEGGPVKYFGPDVISRTTVVPFAVFPLMLYSLRSYP